MFIDYINAITSLEFFGESILNKSLLSLSLAKTLIEIKVPLTKRASLPSKATDLPIRNGSIVLMVK